MEFNIKAEKLQPQQAAALLYVCTDDCACHTQNSFEPARLLCDQLEAGKSFAAARVVENGALKPVAVIRLSEWKRETLEKAAAEAAAWASEQENVGICLNALNGDQAALAVEVLTLTIGQATYRFDRFKKETKPAACESVVFHHADTQAVQAALSVAEAVVYGMNLCRDLGNTASNVCTPEYLANAARTEAEKLGAQAKILDEHYIRENMGAFWSVAKGSVQKPYLIELSYQGAADKQEAPIVLVGKGITFDSGGISLKPGEGMDEMRFDMCGAASVIGAFVAAVKARLPLNLVVLVPTCENMPDAGASKPGDVVTSMNGTTIEILNTDAEGRLILCDALSYAQQFNPHAVIDVATLTGACIIALGHVASAVLGNDQSLVDALLSASREVNDKTWQLPLFDEYKEQLKSNFADLQNIGGRPAGTITAAAFLSHFTQDYAWAHLDIAGVAWKSGKDKGATGRPVPLLLRYLQNQCR